MRKTGMLAAAVVGSSLLFGAPAQATNLFTECSTGVPSHNWHLTARASYTVDGPNQLWHSAGFKLTGAPTSGSSNVNFRLRTGPRSDDDPTHSSYNSPDTLDSNVQYEVPIGVNIPASEYNYVKFHAIFDVSVLPDPSCKAYT